MMIATPARRREAEDLQALLDGRRASTPAAARELGPLVEVAQSLAPADHLPRPGFRAALRDRLLDEMARGPAVEVPGGSPPSRPTRAPRPTARTRLRQAVAVVTVTAVVAGAGAAAASTRALPGDPLYGLKRGIERVELSLARGDLGQGRELLEQADARLGEAEALASGDTSSSPATRARIGQALTDMDTAVTEGAADLTRAYRDTGDEKPMQVLDQFVAEQQQRLDDLMALLSPSLRDRARALLTELGVLGDETAGVLGPQARALGIQELAAAGSGAAGGTVDRLGKTAAGSAAAQAAGGAVGGVLGAVSGAAGSTTGSGGAGSGGSGSSSSSDGGLVGGVLGAVTGGGTTSTSTSGGTKVSLPTATVSAAPAPTSSPLATDPVGTVTSAVPLPTSSALPTVSCVPVPPLTTC